MSQNLVIATKSESKEEVAQKLFQEFGEKFDDDQINTIIDRCTGSFS